MTGDDDSQTLKIGAAAQGEIHPFDNLRLNDRYVIERELARGGVKIVLLARDLNLNSRRVVVAVLLEESARDAWHQKKFQLEKEVLSSIDHPGIVGILDAGQMPDGNPFVVMQYIEGATLRSLIRYEGMELALVARIIRDIGKALGAAHRAGIIHCDLKPENIMLQEIGEGEQQVKILDFGIARLTRGDGQIVSDTTRVAGTPSYMAPEQVAGQPSVSSDIFALGVIAYEMLTGRRPFNPPSQYLIAETLREGVKLRPRTLRPEVSQAAEDVIMKALSYRQEDRYQRAADFGELLAQALTSDLEAASVPPDAGTASLEMAHTLFMDIVSHSRSPSDEQSRTMQKLRDIVSASEEYKKAKANNLVVVKPTGDGMLLAFFAAPEAPCRSAIEITGAVRNRAISLRMGIHSGPVYRTRDINGNEDVAGAGINIAQRVMDFGDAGHILLSGSAAEILNEASDWRGRLHDLGVHKAKHRMPVRVINMWDKEIGNSRRPGKLGKGRSSRLVAAGLAVCVLIAAAAVSRLPILKGTGASDGGALRTAASETSRPERSLTYFIMARKNSSSLPFRLPGEMIFEKGYQIRLSIGSPDQGYLYIVNEGPGAGGAQAAYNTLFPAPGTNNGLAFLGAGSEAVIPQGWFTFDAEQGTEKLWLIWSSVSLADFEALRQWANPADRGEIKDRDQISRLADFLRANSGNRPEVFRDEEKKITTIKGVAEVLVYTVRLEHH